MPREITHELEADLAMELAALLRNKGWTVQRMFMDMPRWQCEIIAAEATGDTLRIQCEGFGTNHKNYEVKFGPGSFATVTFSDEQCWHTLCFLWKAGVDSHFLVVTNPEMRRQNQEKSVTDASIELHRLMTEAGLKAEINA